jgi:hypothetical protein
MTDGDGKFAPGLTVVERDSGRIGIIVGIGPDAAEVDFGVEAPDIRAVRPGGLAKVAGGQAIYLAAVTLSAPGRDSVTVRYRVAARHPKTAVQRAARLARSNGLDGGDGERQISIAIEDDAAARTAS